VGGEAVAVVGPLRLVVLGLVVLSLGLGLVVLRLGLFFFFLARRLHFFGRFFLMGRGGRLGLLADVEGIGRHGHLEGVGQSFYALGFFFVGVHFYHGLKGVLGHLGDMRRLELRRLAVAVV
jgi:hypothetical protein